MFDNIRLWAKLKPYKSIKSHSLDVANVIKKLLETYYVDSITPILMKYLNISKKELINLAQYLGAVHDIGKIHPAFQGKNEDEDVDAVTKQILINEHMYCGDAQAEGYRHESGSFYSLKGIWKTDRVFDETFIDNGFFDYYPVFKLLAKYNYQGYVNPDHHPIMVDGAKRRAPQGYAIGFLRALAMRAAAEEK